MNIEQTREMQEELTERERLVANEAAKIAVQMMVDNFYKEVGRTIIQRVFILVGAIFLGVAYGKGWINLK